MSYNPHFYNDFPHTFHKFPLNIPPPPLPPSFIIPSTIPISDQEYVKQYEANLHTRKNEKRKTASINATKENIFKLATKLEELKNKQKLLETNINDSELWDSSVKHIEIIKQEINQCMGDINDKYLEDLRKQIAKRSAKRLRLKRCNLERKKEKDVWVKEREERSRKIDENLNKIKDDIRRAEMEEQAKIQADIVLKDVLRKKHDAKKCITKLESLVKLRRARQNTARGRGVDVSDKNATTFNNNIVKLKSLWQQKLIIYDKEEADLRAKLKQEIAEPSTLSKEKETEVCSNLKKWRQFLFNADTPQVDFAGDLNAFLHVRSQWDRYINEEGTSLPVGWVIPNSKSLTS